MNLKGSEENPGGASKWLSSHVRWIGFFVLISACLAIFVSFGEDNEDTEFAKKGIKVSFAIYVVSGLILIVKLYCGLRFIKSQE